MAAIAPTVDTPAAGITRVTWAGVTNSDTCQPFMVRGATGISGNLQMTGTPGSATATLGGRNDESSSFVNIPDLSDDAISLTAAGAKDFSTAMLWLAPQLSGGGGTQDLDFVMVLR